MSEAWWWGFGSGIVLSIVVCLISRVKIIYIGPEKEKYDKAMFGIWTR